MAPSRDDDLDWLYGRTPKSEPEPEPTRVSSPHLDTPPPTSVLPPSPATHARDTDGPGTEASQAVPPKKPPRKRRPVRTVLGVLAVLLILAVVALVAVPVYAWSRVTRVDDAPRGERPPNQPGTTFLLLGSDSREGLTKAERKRLGTGSTAGQRTDTVMVLHIPPGGKPALVSIPRDSYVTIPNKGKNKINAAYSGGGPKLMVQTIEQNTGLRVDGYLEIGFGGFVNIIDAVGGIQMCLPKAIKDRNSHLDLPKGCQDLSGTQALGYVRMRYADPKGDLGRVERQRQMLAAVAKKAASPASVLNPVRYWTLCTASADALRLGEDTSAWEMLKLALAMKKVADGSGYTLTVPVSDPNLSTPVGSAIQWDADRSQSLFADLARGDTSDLDQYAK